MADNELISIVDNLYNALGADDFVRDEVLGKEFDTYTPAQKKMARNTVKEALKYFDYTGEKDGAGRERIAGGPFIADENPYKDETFNIESMASVIREALPMYFSEDTRADGAKPRKRDRLQSSGMILEAMEDIDEEETFDAYGFPKGLKPADITKSERGMPSLDERFDNRFDDSDIFPEMRKLNEGGFVESPESHLMFGVGGDGSPLGVSNTDDAEETTPYQNFFVGQQVYTPDQYTAGPVNFYQGALGNPIDVDTVDEDEDDSDDVDVTGLVRPNVEDPTDTYAIPTTTTRMGEGRGASFNVRSHSFQTSNELRSSDFPINFTDFSTETYGTDKTDNFVKDYLKDKGMGIQADVKTESALAPVSSLNPMLSQVVGLAFTKQVAAPFGKSTTTRPAGLLGLGLDVAMAFHAKNATAVQLAGGKAGALMTVNNMLVSRKPGSMNYTGNLMGLSQQQMAGIEATKNGLIAGTLRDEKDDDGNFVTTGMRGLMSADDAFKVGGNVSETGYFIDIYGQGAKLTGAAGLANDQYAAAYEAARSRYGVTQEQFNASLKEAQDKAGTFGTVRGKHRNATFLSDALARYRDSGGAESQAAAAAVPPPAESPAGEQPTARQLTDRELAALGYVGTDDEGPSRDASSYAVNKASTRSDVGGLYDKNVFAEGGRAGYALGGQPPAAPAGFVEGKPEQFTDGQKVADDKPMEVNEGTFVINAAAVEIAGSEDIKKMLVKAYEIANQREGLNVERPRYEEAIDIAVSRGEVIVPPQLARVIGYDRLEKINNRGKKETKQRIEEAEQVQQAAEGGFIGMSQGGFVDLLRGILGIKKEPVITNPKSPAQEAPTVSNEGFASPPPTTDTRPAVPSTPLPEPTEFENLTNDLLQILEDNKFEGYVPTGDSKNNSGVTIGRGFDLGQHKPGDLERMGLDNDLIARFTPYLNKKGKAARDALAYEKSQGRPLKFTEKEEGVLEDLNLTVQRAKYDDFVNVMGKLNKPIPHNDAARAAVFSEFYVGAFKTKQKKGGGLELTIRKSFMDELVNTGNVYSAFQAGIAGKTNKGSATRNRAEKTMKWLEENDGMAHSFDKYVGGDDSHYVDTRTGERVPIHTKPTPPPPRRAEKTGMMADVTLPTPKPTRD